MVLACRLHAWLVGVVPVPVLHRVLRYQGAPCAHNAGAAAVTDPSLRPPPSPHPSAAAQLEITSFVSSLIYFGYMAIISLTFFLITGSIGFLVCLEFVRRIYGAIKVD